MEPSDYYANSDATMATTMATTASVATTMPTTTLTMATTSSRSEHDQQQPATERDSKSISAPNQDQTTTGDKFAPPTSLADGLVAATSFGSPIRADEAANGDQQATGETRDFVHELNAVNSNIAIGEQQPTTTQPQTTEFITPTASLASLTELAAESTPKFAGSQRAAIVHTDQLSASSKLLYVHTKPPSTPSMAPTQDSSRLSVLDLEVGASGARLAWSIAHLSAANSPRPPCAAPAGGRQRRATKGAPSTLTDPTISKTRGTNSRIVVAEPKSAQMTKSGRSIRLAATSADDQSSRWFVRLRRFGSNDFDMIKLVVNRCTNLVSHHAGAANATAKLSASDSAKQRVRFITIKNLVPSTGYEICIEAAKESQQLEDKFHILNSNHNYHAQDDQATEWSPSLNITTNGNKTTVTPTMQTSRSQPTADESNSMILCKEFFTLDNQQPQQLVSLVWGPKDAKTTAATSNLVEGDSEPSESTASATTDSAGNHTQVRRPKSLPASRDVRSRVELLEINDDDAERGDSQRDDVTASLMDDNYELVASPALASNAHNQQRLWTQTSSPAPSEQQSLFTRWLLAAAPTPTSSQAAGGLLGGGPNAAQYALGWAFPLVAGVLLLVLLFASATLLISWVSGCSGRRRARAAKSASDELNSARRRRHRRPTDSPSPLNGRGNLSQLLRPYTQSSSGSSSFEHKQRYFNGGYLATNSDGENSLGNGERGSQSSSRIMVVGNYKSRQPFAQSSVALFELPQQTATSSSHQASLATNSKSRSQQLVSSLVSSARFPLGPSFEGDERHNADMVGLARKNYDQFISQMYNLEGNSSSASSASSTSTKTTHSNSTSSLAVAGDAHAKTRKLLKHRANHHVHKVKPTPREDSDAGAKQQQYHYSGAPASSQQQPQQQQRIKYDKINPIYNMIDHRKSSSVSSFGHPTAQPAGLVDVAPDTPNVDGGCEQCEPSHECTSSLIGASNEPSSGVFACCLDRQQQRFSEQQQQLDRVRGKIGCFVPQPKIKAIDGLNAVASGDTHSNQAPDQLHQREMGTHELIGVAGDHKVSSSSASTSSSVEAPPSPEDQTELKTAAPPNAIPSATSSVQPPPPPPPPPPLASEPPQAQPQTKPKLPAPPPPLLPSPVASPNKEPARVEGPKRPPVELTMGQLGASRRQTEAEQVDRQTFKQLRSELAAKLNFDARPQPPPS